MTAQTILPANTLSSGYDVANSVRLDGSSAYMGKTMGTPTDADKYTFSFWCKRSKLGAQQSIFRSTDDGTNDSHVTFQSDDTLRFEEYGGSASIGKLQTTQVFRDVSSWYHIVLVYDSGNGTAGNRMRMYVNGSEVTAFGTDNNPSQNADSFFNKDGEALHFGRTSYGGGANYFGGYVAEVVMCDGQAYAASDFGEFDEDSPTIWKPKDVSGLTFGNNGFYLDFEDSSNLGNDANGGTDFSETNLAATDQTTDTCTNNFATINPLDNYWAGATLEEGNTKVSTGSSNEAMSTSTFAMTAGRWYMEADFISGAGARMCGVTPTVSFQTSSHGKAGDVTPHTATYIGSGKVQEGNGSGGQTELADYNSYATGDIIGIYLDLEDMKVYFSKNGTLNSSTGIDLDSLATVEASYGTGHYMFFVGDNNSGALVCEANFGNGFQSLSSAVADDNGFGAFEYSPNITGDGTAKSFYSVCSKNLAEFG